jgi:excisionase family DNA binding protein
MDFPRPDEISMSQACIRLRAPYHIVRNLVLRGEIGARQIGRSWYLKIADVDRHQSASDEQIARPA